MKSEEVARYLQDHPQFFEEHAELMSHMVIPHPHGGRTISITERQMLSLRDKNKQLEVKMNELLQFGEENDAIGEKDAPFWCRDDRRRIVSVGDCIR